MNKILLILFLSVSLFAGHSGEIYTYGYFQYVQEALIALSGVVANGNDYLFKIVVALAMLVFTIKNLGNTKTGSLLAFETAKFLTVVTLIQQLFLTAPDDDKHAYAIVDRITNQTAEVRQIPKGIGEMLSLFSRLEDAVMEKMDMFFSTPNSTSYRNAGLGFSMTSQMEIFQSSIIDPNLKRSFDTYYENCKMLGDYSDGTEDINAVLNSTDLMSTLSTTQSLLTVVYDSANPDGVTTPCFEAWNTIKSGIISSASNQMDAIAQARGLTGAIYGSKAEDVYQTMYGSFLSAQAQFEEAILRNSTLEAVQGVASNLGIGAERLAKNKSIAEMSMITEAGMSNLEAQGIIPIIKAVSMILIISLSWLLAILAISTMNMSYLKTLVVLNVWLMLWSPLYTVLNFAMDVMVNSSLAAYDAGVAINSQMSMYQVLGAKLAVLAKLVWAVPMLAFAVAKGSDHAMTSFIGGMAQGVQSGISTANSQELRQTTSGNFSYISGNEQFSGSATGRGHERRSMYQTEHGLANMDVTQNKDGAETASNGVGGSVKISSSNNGGYGVDVNSSGISATQTAGTQQSRRSAQQEISTINNSTGITTSDAKQKMLSAVHNMNENKQETIGDGVSIGDSQRIAEVVSKSEEAAAISMRGKGFTTTIENSEGESERISGYIGADGRLNLDSKNSIAGWVASKISGFNLSASAGGGIKFDSEGNLTVNKRDGTTETLKMDDSFREAYQTNLSKSLDNTIASNESYNSSWATGYQKSVGISDSDVKSTQKALSEAYSKANSASNTLESAKTLNESISQGKLPAMFQNYFKEDEKIRDMFFDESGKIKDLDSQKALTEHSQSLINHWTQDGEKGLEDFKFFAMQYGGDNLTQTKEDFKMTNDKTIQIVDNKIEGAEANMKTVNNHDDIEAMKVSIDGARGAIEGSKDSFASPETIKMNAHKDLPKSSDIHDIVGNKNGEIYEKIENRDKALKTPDTMIKSTKESLSNLTGDLNFLPGGSGQTPNSSQFNSEQFFESSLIKDFSKPKSGVAQPTEDIQQSEQLIDSPLIMKFGKES